MRQNFTRWLINLRQASFFATALLLPVQLSKFFWPESAFVLGIRIDYLAPVIYLSDFSILAFILFSATLLFLKSEPLRNGRLFLSISLFAISVILSLIFAHSVQVAVIKAAKLMEFLLFSFFVSLLSFEKIFRVLLFIFGLSLLWLSLVSLAQFERQASVGLSFLGERTFNLSTPGISQLSHDGTLFLRPYATFPHPNVLAAFITLLTTMIFGALLVLKFNRSERLFFWSAFLLGVLTLFLTFSRASWIASFGALLFILASFFTKKTEKKLLSKKQILTIFGLGAGVLIIFTLLSPLVFERFFSVTTSDAHSLVLRTKLAQASITMIGVFPFFGVGPGNFLVILPSFWQISETIRFIQPVHNLFLLVAAELGIFGLMSFLLLLALTFLAILKSANSFLRLIFLVLLGQIVFLSFFDHYFWTLQQGLLMFWFFLGIFFSFSLMKDKSF